METPNIPISSLLTLKNLKFKNLKKNQNPNLNKQKSNNNKPNLVFSYLKKLNKNCIWYIVQTPECQISNIYILNIKILTIALIRTKSFF